MEKKDINKIAFNIGKATSQIEGILEDIKAFQEAETPNEISLAAIQENVKITLEILKDCGKSFLR